MDPDELDELFDECERAVAIGALEELVALCTRAEIERALTSEDMRQSAAGEHARKWGHRLSFGCCLRAYESGAKSLIDVDAATAI